MDLSQGTGLIAWLTAAENPAVRYLTFRNLVEPRPSPVTLERRKKEVWAWGPLRRILELQRPDGGFPARQGAEDARPTFWALGLMHRCGLDVDDGPVARAIDFLSGRYLRHGAVSYDGGGSGVLPCYAGIVTTTLIGMGALEHEIAQASLRWLVEHQRFDHRETRAGGDEPWPFRAPRNFGCFESVSCYHGVAGAFRALAAVPIERRSDIVRQRLGEAIGYLRIHRLYKRSASDAALFRHMTQSFLVGDYRSDLLDMLQGIVDADPALVREAWVRAAVEDMHSLTEDGRVPLVKNYGRTLAEPIPLEPVGEASRFLTYQWLRVRKTLEAALDPSDRPAWTV